MSWIETESDVVRDRRQPCLGGVPPHLRLYLTLRGYHSFDGDQAYRLPLLLHRQDPSLYQDDPFVRAFDVFNPHRGYLALLDWSSRPLGIWRRPCSGCSA